MALVSNQQLRKKIQDYKPDKGNRSGTAFRPRKISIRLFGRPGHGKSTFINNCLCVVRDAEYRNEAAEGDTSGGSTVELKPYNLSDCVNIVDNRGAKLFDSNEVYEYSAQLDGLRKEGQRINFDGWIPYLWDWVTSRDPEWQSTLYIPVLIYRADFLSFDTEEKTIEKFINFARKHTGIWPIIVVTRATDVVNLNIKSVFQSLHCPDIFFLKNYHQENSEDGREIAVERNEDTDQMILQILLRCLKRADDLIEKITTTYKPKTFE